MGQLIASRDVTNDDWTWFIHAPDMMGEITPQNDQQPVDKTSQQLYASVTGDPYEANYEIKLNTGRKPFSFYLKDHLGNTRVKAKGSGCFLYAFRPYKAESFYHYFPYGRHIAKWEASSNNTNYQFTGQERDHELDWDYFIARNYDYDAGRFFGVDALKNDYPAWSSYNYVMGNPIMMTDPLGLSPWKAKIDENTGEPVYVAEEGDNIETFVNQFDVSIEDALDIFSENNFKTSSADEVKSDVSTGDEIRGAGFLRYNLSKTGRGFFKSGYWSKETQQRTIDHVNFASKYAIANGLDYIDLGAVLNYSPEDIAGFFGGGCVTFQATYMDNKIAMDLSLMYDNTKVSIYPSREGQRMGTMFGKSQYMEFKEYNSPDGRLPIMRISTPAK